jgi:hypothetical protein
MLVGRFALVTGAARSSRSPSPSTTAAPSATATTPPWGRVYVMPRASLDSIAGFAPIGVDVLDEARLHPKRRAGGTPSRAW